MNTYKIADLIVHMDTFGRTLAQAEPYRIADDENMKPDIKIVSKPEHVLEKNSLLTLDECEYLSSGASFCRQLVQYDSLMLHSSCVVVDERAYLFSAPCGTGKSTHVRLWLELFGDRAYILNDDKPVLRIIDGEIYAYGTPWSGKEDLSRNERVLLGGIAVVERATENSICPLDPQRALYSIFNQTTRFITPMYMGQFMDTVGKIVESGKIYKLSCNMDISAARLSYETMSGKRFTV